MLLRDETDRAGVTCVVLLLDELVFRFGFAGASGECTQVVEGAECFEAVLGRDLGVG